LFFVRNKFVVFNDDVNENEVDGESDRMCGSAKVKRDRTYKHALKGFSSKLTPAAIEEMRRNPKVKYIEQNQVATIVATQNSATWGLDRIDQHSLPLTTTYTYNTNGSVVDAYIFDTGIRLDHAEFSGRLGAGYNAINTAATANDDQGHGTHVAGIIAASRQNKIGINGIANNVEIMTIRAVPDGDEHDKDIANAIRYAVDNGAWVVNMSFGKSFSPEKKWVDDAVKYAESKGVLLVHAAGNDSKNIDTEDNFPSRNFDNDTLRVFSNWINVGASGATETDLAASFSNYGKREVNVFAPGVKIYSSIPGGNTYGDKDGTSMASPVVAGLAALILSYYPDLSAEQVKNIIEQSAMKPSTISFT
jgi:subtilisin family serine protease